VKQAVEQAVLCLCILPPMWRIKLMLCQFMPVP